MGGLGAGLLGFAQGAMGGAEQYIQEEREHERKFSLEDYRLEKEKEVAEFKAQLEAEADASKYARERGDKVYDDSVVSAETEYKEGEATKRAEMAANASGSASRATESSLKRAWTSGASVINSTLGEQLKDANLEVNDAYELPSDPQEYLAVLDVIGGPVAQAYKDLINDYLDNIDVWSREDIQDWKADFRAVGNDAKSSTGNDPLGLRK